MFSKTIRYFSVVLFVCLFHFIAKAQGETRIVIDKGVFLFKSTPSCSVKTNLVNTVYIPAPYNPRLLPDYLNFLFNTNSIIEVSFYNTNNTNTVLGTILINNFSGGEYHCTLNSFNGTRADFIPILSNPNPQITYTIKVWEKQCMTSLGFYSTRNCGSSTQSRIEGNITIFPSNIPVIYERETSPNTWVVLGAATTRPFRTTVNGTYRVKTNSGSYLPDLIVFTGLRGCPFSPTGDFLVTPNPTTTSAILSYKIPEKGIIDIQLYDISGKALKNIAQKREIEPGLNQILIDLNDLPKGLYFLQLFDGIDIKIQKIIKSE